jgi:hypothetical protein
MIQKYLDLLNTLPTENRAAVQGYSLEELKKIESLYDIKIEGNFKEFMLIAGRSSGNLLGDEPIVLYRNYWSVRSQIRFQLAFIDELKELKIFDYLKNPFVIGFECETQYYFLRTELEDGLIYHYDENNDVVKEINMNIEDYLLDAVKRYSIMNNPYRSNVICRGELLII